MLPPFLDQWRSIASSRFVFNMFQGHHLQLGSHPSVFHNFQQFNIEAVATHHPNIQKEVEKLLVKRVIEPSSGVTGFYSSVFVGPKYTGGLGPILNLQQLSFAHPFF